MRFIAMHMEACFQIWRFVVTALLCLGTGSVMVSGCDDQIDAEWGCDLAILDSVAVSAGVSPSGYSNHYLGLYFYLLPESKLVFVDKGGFYESSFKSIPDYATRTEIKESTLFVATRRSPFMVVRGRYQCRFSESNIRSVRNFIEVSQEYTPVGLRKAGIEVSSVDVFVEEVDGLQLNCIEYQLMHKDDEFIKRDYVIPTPRGIVSLEIMGEVAGYYENVKHVLNCLDLI